MSPPPPECKAAAGGAELLGARGTDLRLEEEARAAGLDVRDGTVERSWGITGVADAHSVDEAERVRASLQERVHHVVTTLGRHRTLLTAECARASELLRTTSAALRA